MKRKSYRPTLFYSCLTLFFSAAFFLLMREPVLRAVPETDNWWMLPVFSYYVGGKGPAELFRFILLPSSNYFHPPLLKTLFWLIDHFLRLPFSAFLAAGLLIHLLNSVLLGCLCRLLGLSRGVAVASAVIFGTIFLHFHAYLWLPVSQHPASIMTILTVMTLFLLTERRIRRREPSGWLYALTALAATMASLQDSGLIALPVLLSAPWLMPGLTLDQRRQLHGRWFPVLVLFLVYRLPVIATFYDDLSIHASSKWPYPSWLKAAGLLGSGVGLLLFAGRLLRFRGLGLRGLFLLGAAAWVGFALWDHRQALLPYHALVPWMTVLGSFLDPIRSAMGMDPSDSYYYMPAHVSPFHALLALLLLGLFVAGFARRKKQLFLLGVWYAAVLAYLLLHRHVASSMPFRTQSRYFLYLTPLFSVVFSCALLYGLTLFARKAGWSRRARDLMLAGFLLALCVPNLLAIRLALFRGRLTNTYLIYDDARLAHLIREEAAAQGGAVSPDRLAVRGAVPTLFTKMPWKPPVDYARIGHDNLRRLLGEAFGDRRMRAVRINEASPAGPGTAVYRIEEERVLDPKGRSIEPFSRTMSDALSRMREGKDPEAAALFKEAVRQRPFLLNYLLGPPLRLSDLGWITGGEDFRSLLGRVDVRHRRWGVGPQQKSLRTSRLVRRELSDYVLCLFCLSALERRAGREGPSRFWLSQIGFIERDPERLSDWLGGMQEVRSDASLSAFAERVRDPASFEEPWAWKKEDYAFGRFLVRLVFHRDLRSEWDRRSDLVP